MNQTVTIPLTEGESALLNSTAQQLGVSPQQLARSSIVDALNRLQNDSEFASAVKAVLTTNEELYQRLAK